MLDESGLTLAKALAKLRHASGFTQRALAERLDVNPTYLSHIEAGRREPSLSLLRRFAVELEVPTGILLAVALWSEIPAAEKPAYERILRELVELATVTQLGLPLGTGEDA